MKTYIDKAGLQDFTTKLTAKFKTVFALKGETATDEQVENAVIDWLEENADFVIDPTLSVEGSAAEAKTTGDEFTNVKSELTTIENLDNYDIALTWEHGGIDNATGQTNNDGSTSRSRDVTYYAEKHLKSITNGSTSKLWIIFYKLVDGTYTFLSSTSVNGGDTYNFALGTSRYVRFDIRGSLSQAALVSAVGIYELTREVLNAQAILPEVYCKNIVGEDITMFYPCNLAPGEYVTMSTSDGTAVGTYDVDLLFYNENKIQIDRWNFSQANSQRTVQNAQSETVKYMSWKKVPTGKHLQVEYGRVKTDYQEYFPNVKAMAETIGTEGLKKELSNSWNSTLHNGLTDFKTPCTRFTDLMIGDTVNEVEAVSKCESFLFFTDPHTMHNTTRFEEYLGQIQKIYHSTPANFVICGGDWLGNSDTPSQACYKLGRVGASCRTMLEPCYMLVGNHDTNYQGKKDSASATYTTRLPNESIRNLLYEGKKAYYSFDGSNTRFYCFDTGTESQTLSDFDNYGYEQALWFLQSLIDDDPEHSAISMHMYYTNNAETTWSAIAHLIMQIAAAYNTRGSIVINNNAYSFAGKTGKVEFAIAGHTHFDSSHRFTESGADIPVIITKDVGNGQTYPLDATFDLVFADYDNRQISCVRVGNGSDRTFSLG